MTNLGAFEKDVFWCGMGSGGFSVVGAFDV